MGTSVSTSLKNCVATISCSGLLAAVAVLLWVPSVRAGPDRNRTNADVQCLIVGARLSESSDPGQKLSGGMLMTYFLGRIDGRAPGANIESLIVETLATMTASDLVEASHRCRAEFSER